jgi:hypothetical protein
MRTVVFSWNAIAAALASRGPGARVRIEKFRVEHPRDGGLAPSLGLPVGQRADWRLPSPGCGPLHVREYDGHYVAHLGRANPNCDPIGHLASDAPQVMSGVAFGALLGLLLGRSKEATLAGAALGGLMGLAAAQAKAAGAKE